MERSKTLFTAVLPDLLASYRHTAWFEASILCQRAQDALRESEQRFWTVLQDSPHGILICHHTQPLWANQAIATMFGYARPEHLLGLKTIVPLIAPQDRSRYMAYSAARLGSDPVASPYTYQGRRQDGTPLWVDVHATAIWWNGASVTLSVHSDITASKQAEVMLTRYHLLAEQTRDIILFLRPDGQIVDVNQAAVAAYGYDRATLLTMAIADLRDPATLPLLAEQLAQANQHGHRFEILHRRQDGSRFPVEVSSIGATIGDERLLLHIVRDITERKAAEIAREQLAAIVASSEDAIIGQTLEGRITIWNRGAERLYGYTEAEALGQSLAMLIPADLSDDLPQILQRLQRGERIDHYETQRRHKDGTRLDVALTISPIRDSTGRLLGASKVARNITARKRAEAALQRAYVELEQHLQAAQHFAMLGRLMAGFAHEIRNPLGVIFLYTDLLEEELQQPSTDGPTEMAQSLVNIKTQVAHLNELVQDYLTLARLATIELTPQEMGTAVQAWTAEVQGLATARGVTLRLDGLAELGTVALHASTLRRAVLNLVRNALEAMAAGGTLTLTGQGTATQVQLHIRDTGTGLSAATLARLFEPLYTTKPEGTGLGLSIVQQIVAAHGGQITVASVEGQGTTFTITLPRGASAGPSQERSAGIPT